MLIVSKGYHCFRDAYICLVSTVQSQLIFLHPMLVGILECIQHILTLNGNIYQQLTIIDMNVIGPVKPQGVSMNPTEQFVHRITLPMVPSQVCLSKL